jgi:hypothetical protein
LNYAGKIQIYDSNNGLSILVIHRAHKLWKKSEKLLRKKRSQLLISYGIDKHIAEKYGKHTKKD